MLKTVCALLGVLRRGTLNNLKKVARRVGHFFIFFRALSFNNDRWFLAESRHFLVNAYIGRFGFFLDLFFLDCLVNSILKMLLRMILRHLQRLILNVDRFKTFGLS